MGMAKQWIQSATVGVDEESGAILVRQESLSPGRVEIKTALPNNGQKTIELGQVCRVLILSVPAGATCTYSLKGPANANSPDLDDTMLVREESLEGVDKLYIYTSSNMSAYKISIRGW